MRDSFTPEQIALIQLVLDETSFDDCVPKKVLFESIQEYKSDLFEMELYQFERLLTKAIRSDSISGYSIRQGRSGGICKKDSFKSVEPKELPVITFNGKSFKLLYSKKKLLSLIIKSGTPGENGNGNLFINNKLYQVPEKIDTLQFLEEYLNLEN